MGPHFEPGDDQFELRPFETSQTYKNLAINPFGVLHVTDDVLLIARAAINKLAPVPSMTAAENGAAILDSASHWMEFSAQQIPNDTSRKSFHCRTTREGTGQRFYGFNRAKHAVLEATILATRVDFIPLQEIQAQYQHLATLVEKTGGIAEKAAFSLLNEYVNSPIAKDR